MNFNPITHILNSLIFLQFYYIGSKSSYAYFIIYFISFWIFHVNVDIISWKIVQIGKYVIVYKIYHIPE